MKELFWAILLGVVEGVTEFLPISSTGHLLLCQHWLGIDLENDPFWKMFAIFIQLGAILAVVVYFRGRIADLLRKGITPVHGSRITPVWLVMIATAPALIVGYLSKDWVERTMETPAIIAWALIVGGVLMLLIEWRRRRARTDRMEKMSLAQCLAIGCAQCLAILFPGTSRSAATILSGLMVGMSREAAAEFSFFLAIPAMFAASSYSLLKHVQASPTFSGREAMLLAIGTLVSFLVAWVVIAAFMSYIRRHSFAPFAWYRIVLGMVVIAVMRWM